MAFEPLDFLQLNEADIREEVIAPLLRRLGYRSGTVNNVIREQPLSLRYPRDLSNPTRFVSRRIVIFPQGERVLNLATWNEDVFQMNIPCETLTTAEGVLDGQVFSGQFFLSISLAIPGITVAPLETVGRFEIHVA